VRGTPTLFIDGILHRGSYDAATVLNALASWHGVGSRLVRGALDDIRSRGLRVAPVCPFVADYLRRHPEQRDLVVRDPATPE
jgi:hypothetical protein